MTGADYDQTAHMIMAYTTHYPGGKLIYIIHAHVVFALVSGRATLYHVLVNVLQIFLNSLQRCLYLAYSTVVAIYLYTFDFGRFQYKIDRPV